MRVKSQYIKSTIKGKSFGDRSQRQYIQDLADIERYILDPPKCKCGIRRFLHLEEDCPADFKAIYIELDSKGYRRRMDARSLAAPGELERRYDEEVAETKVLWLKCGGKA